MSRLPWIRLYTEARNDRKLRMLTDHEFRVWFDLLLYAAETEPRGVFAIDDVLAIEVANGDESFLSDSLGKLERLHLIEIEGDLGYFPAFADRQYAAGGSPSTSPDAVAERVRRHREKKRRVTPCNDKSREDTDKKDLYGAGPVDNVIPVDIRAIALSTMKQVEQ